jgi:UDP:flavonoid glycosyltransferase YjiC (YdhE family)
MARMRVLVTTTGAAGHFTPLVPFARALLDAGDEVLVATRASTVPTVERAGFATWTYGEPPAEERSAIFAQADGLPPDEMNALVIRELFARRDVVSALPRIRDAVDTWRPDVVLHETGEMAGPTAAELAGVPRVQVSIVFGSSEFKFLGPALEGLAPIRADLGLPVEVPPPAATFTLFPLAIEDPELPGPPGVRRFREELPSPGALPDWWPGNEDPLVYVTFGSVAADFGTFPALYAAALRHLAPLPVRLLMTTGRNTDLSLLGDVPANAHVEQWVPQQDVTPHAAAIVCHGGSGTVRDGLAGGVPLVVIPLFADQPYNAARVASAGAGIALPPRQEGFPGLADAVLEVLGEPAYKAKAMEIRADNAALPPASAAVDVIHALRTSSSG